MGVQTEPSAWREDGGVEAAEGWKGRKKSLMNSSKGTLGFLLSLSFFDNKQQRAAKLLSDQSVTPREDERMKRQPHSLSSNQFSSLSCQ